MPILQPSDLITIAGEKHRVLAQTAVDTELVPKKAKAQKNRHIKIVCANPACPGKHGPYYVRVTERRYKDDGAPICPVDGFPLVPEGEDGGEGVIEQLATEAK